MILFCVVVVVRFSEFAVEMDAFGEVGVDGFGSTIVMTVKEKEGCVKKVWWWSRSLFYR